jgi:hypothetical protein
MKSYPFRFPKLSPLWWWWWYEYDDDDDDNDDDNDDYDDIDVDDIVDGDYDNYMIDNEYTINSPEILSSQPNQQILD